MIPTATIDGQKSRIECRTFIADLAMKGTSETRVIESKLELFEFPHEVIEQNVKVFR